MTIYIVRVVTSAFGEVYYDHTSYHRTLAGAMVELGMAAQEEETTVTEDGSGNIAVFRNGDTYGYVRAVEVED